MSWAGVFDIPLVRTLARRASDWIDLQWSLLIDSLNKVAPQARGRLLDVGCGAKPYQAIFQPFVSQYVGIEHSDTFSATSAVSHAVKPDVIYSGDRLPFADGSFDTVLSVQVLEHTPHPAALVAEMSRVLSREGLLILTAPFQFRLHEVPHDYFRYSPHGLRQLCGDAGLELTEVHQQGSLWSVIGHKINSYLAFRVARITDLAQAMGKHGHEAPSVNRTRLWTLPWVAPSMIGLALGARVLDRLLFDPEESLGYLVIARHRRSGGQGAQT
jgi:SAM-dependent methyltransferase